ncbi:MAG TPA: class I SAM-dependent methyltransferase [Hyphomonadaceae bacterium]|jgi:SAM-dependent methyltransferase|nr:class I SAM-dependent methyltransferase [Hyphomonadaceae bacterium]
MIEDSPSARQWNARYASSEYVFGREPSAFLVREANRLPRAGRILCVADGEGRNSVWLAKQGFDVHAVDISEVGLAKAQLLAADANVHVKFELADVVNWSWPVAAYDAVVAIFIQFAGPTDRTNLFSSMKLALRPGGLLLLHGYRPEQVALGTGGPPQVENMYDELLVRAAFCAMEIEYLHTYDADLQEGLGHRGPSALIDLIARKRP